MAAHTSGARVLFLEFLVKQEGFFKESPGGRDCANVHRQGPIKFREVVVYKGGYWLRFKWL